MFASLVRSLGVVWVFVRGHFVAPKTGLAEVKKAAADLAGRPEYRNKRT
jgi:hypothetical protein